MSEGRSYNEMDAQTRLIMREVAEEAANKAVNDTFLRFGLDPANPIQAQREFAMMRSLVDLASDEEWWKDQHHNRRWRKTINTLESKSFIAAMGFFTLGIIAAIVYGVQSKFGIGG